MVKTPEITKPSAVKKTIKFSDKFGLEKDRFKIGAVTNDKVTPPTLSPGKNFSITWIKITESKKRYNHTDKENGEITKGKISIAQFNVITEDGENIKFYSPNSAIVEACENILKDPDFRADEKGNLEIPAEIGEVIAGKGEGNFNYIAFA